VHRDGYFFYEGTRKGLLRLQPFRELRFTFINDFGATLEYVEEWEVVDTIDARTGKVVHSVCVPKRVRCFELQVVEHETTTPKEWNVRWYETVERVPGTDTAVIMDRPHGGYVRMIVPYKNVYTGEQRQGEEQDEDR